ncbi:MAG TPA: T9SS type A sorting domain-containing protein [Candidatus Sabulitectum sp.]|nr:T9SS type A sorting domain-containing protein [Candidatus Sabulitectum sp.]
MRTGIVFFVLLLLSSQVPAADRVVLFEDFTNSGCNPCWVAEPSVNAFVNANLPNGNLAVIRCHVNWPSPSDPIYLANPTEQTVRKAQYGISGVPTFKFDGILNGSSGNLQAVFDSRASVPAIIDIEVARNGDASSGTLSIMIVAEEDPQWTVPMMVWPILVEDNIPGAGYWSGSVFEQAFRDNLLGYYGEEISFDGPYPDTIYVDADYEISASWDADELYLATFIQCAYQYQLHEVENAHWAKFMDLETGIEDAGWNGWQEPVLSVGPNPSPGTFSISAIMPGNTGGTVEVFDLSGRTIASGAAASMQSVTVDESGIYLVRLSTPEGMHATESVAVVR